MQAAVQKVRTPMKRLAISVILASLNLLLIGLYFLASWRKIGCCGWGSPGNILLLAVVPVVLLASLVFVIRDLIRPPTRLQAILALVLLVPSAIMVFSIRLS
jgi:hypothetical protein